MGPLLERAQVPMKPILSSREFKIGFAGMSLFLLLCVFVAGALA